MAADHEDLARAKAHIRFLYGIQVVFAALSCGGFYAGFIEIDSMRADMQRELARLQPVEFGGFETDARASDYEAKARVSADDEDSELGGEQLLRVRRQAISRPMHGNGEGSGSGGVPAAPEDDMWITSYARVPVSAVQGFCRATKEYCPSIPGSRGLPGEPGEAGSKGDRGDPGFPGVTGPPGDKGDKGDGSSGSTNENNGHHVHHSHKCSAACPEGPPGPKGDRGVPGILGPPGEPGVNGTDGQRGKRGRHGMDGLKGDTGPVGITGPTGPPGRQGTRGLTGMPGAPGMATDNCTCPIMEGLPGPPGPMGPQGSRGSKGQKGEAGNTFLSGSERRIEQNTTPASTTPASTTAIIPTTPEPTIEPREEDCMIRMVGKPLFQRYTGTYWGAWLKDPKPADYHWAAKHWFTRHFTGKLLYEYRNLEDFRQDRISKTYELKELYFGTGHVVYKGSFYYHRTGYNEIVRYDLHKQQTVAKMELQDALYKGKDYLYSTEYNYFDLAVDENGLWVIYTAENTTNQLLVAKLNPDTLHVEKRWNITINHRGYGNGFITCGILYLVKDTHAQSTVIDFAYDLYSKELLPQVRLKFSNPFTMNNMISYNPADHKIYSWDRGNQLTYPLLV